MPSPDVLISVHQTGVNALSQIYQALALANALWGKQIGTTTSGLLTANTLIYSEGPARIVGLSLLGGSGSAYLHDVDDIATIDATTRVYLLPTTTGFYPLNIITTLGLALEIDTSTECVVTYAPET